MFKFSELINLGRTLKLVKPLLNDFEKNYKVIGSLMSGMSTKTQIYQMQLMKLNETQMQQVLISQGMSKSDAQATLAKMGLTATTIALNKEEVKSVLTKFNLNTKTINQILATKNLTAALLEQKLAQTSLNAETQEAIVTQLTQQGIIGKTGSYFSGLGASFKKFGKEILGFVTSTKGVISIAIAAASILAISTITAAAEAFQKNIDKIEELKTEIDNLEGSIKSLQGELSTTVDRLNELSDKENLTIFEKEELSNLQSINTELSRNIKLQQQQLELKKQESNQTTQKAIKDAMTAGSGTQMQWWEYLIPVYSEIKGGLHYFDSMLGATMGTTFSQGQGKIDEYAKRAEEIKKLEEELNDLEVGSDDYKAIDELIKSKEAAQSAMAGDISTISETYSTWLQGLDPSDSTNKEIIDQLNTSLDTIDKALNLKPQGFTELYADTQYSSVVKDLEDLAKANKLTEETFNDVKGIDTFKSAFEEMGYSLEDVINEVYSQVGEVVPVTVKSLSDLQASSEELSKTLDTTFSNQSTLQSAFDKIIAGTSLTNDEVLKLIDICPELSGAFTKTADGWTTDVDNIISANESVVKSMRETIEEQIKLREASSRKSKDNIDSLTIARNKVPTEGVAHFTAQIEAENLAISENEKEISKLNTLLDMLGLSLSEDSSILTEIKANIEELGKSTNTLITEAKSVSEVFAEQSENGELSAESVMKIVESGYAAALMYDKETGAIKLNAEAYQMLAEAKIAEQKVTIESDKAEAIVKRAELEAKAIGYLGASYIMTAGAADAYNQVREEMSDVDEQIAGYDAYMSLLNNLMSKFADITNGTYGATGSSTDKIKEAFDKAKKELDHLLKMNLITQKDYYARLNALNEQYYANSEKHSDEYQSNLEEIYSGINELQKKYLDEQIDAINEKADAEDKALSLKEKELEVEEKLAALNRAKKDKIRIFNGQSGVFDWGVDAEKLASAQSEYDKAVADLKDYKADEQRSEIITLIKEIRDNIGIEGSNPLSSGYTPISTEDLIKRFGGNYKGDLSSILSNVSSKTTTPNINGLAGTIANGVVTNNSSNSSNNVSIVLNGVDLSNSTEVKNAVYEALIDVFADPKVK